jgi:nucleotide-binding universal stress UspA family protein
MHEVLVPVVDDHDQRWVVDFLAQEHERDPLVVHLLSVQPRYSGHVRMFVDPALIHEAQEEDAQAQMKPMCEALSARGIPYHAHVVEGSTAEQIASYAQAHDCQQIVIGPPRAGWSSERVLGSVNRQVEQLLRHAGRPCEVL